MYIHIGDREIVSATRTIGIFNFNTLLNSEYNQRIKECIDKSECDIKTIVIDTDNNIKVSKVSSFTVIKRVSIDSKDCIWRRR